MKLSFYVTSNPFFSQYPKSRGWSTIKSSYVADHNFLEELKQEKMIDSIMITPQGIVE